MLIILKLYFSFALLVKIRKLLFRPKWWPPWSVFVVNSLFVQDIFIEATVSVEASGRPQTLL